MTTNIDSSRYDDPQAYIDELLSIITALVWKLGKVPSGTDRRAEREAFVPSTDFVRAEKMQLEWFTTDSDGVKFRAFNPENDITEALRTAFTNVLTRELFVPDPLTLKRSIKTVFGVDL